MVVSGWAALVEPEPVTVQSRSGLFTIRGPEVPWESLYNNNFVGDRPLKIDPRLLAVSCEQIKESLLTELGYSIRRQILAGNHSFGLAKIFIVLHKGTDQTVDVSSVPSASGPAYRLDLPNEMFTSRLVEAVTEVLLLDLTNQHNNGQLASLPHWFVNGMVGYLQATGLENLPLEANLPITKIKVRENPVAQIHARMQDRLPLTFDQLSWPEKLSKEEQALFEDSATLLVSGLLHLKNGPTALRQMVDTLPNYKNWQFAFLDAFRSDFTALVDVEKWWSLTLVDFTGRDPARIWSKEDSLKQLDATLKIPALIQTATNTMPQRTELTVQKVISDWDFTRQEKTVRKLIGQMRMLRLRVPTEMVPLVDEYRVALEKYLIERSQTGVVRSKFAPTAPALKKSMCKELDRIDDERAAMRREVIASKK